MSGEEKQEVSQDRICTRNKEPVKQTARKQIRHRQPSVCVVLLIKIRGRLLGDRHARCESVRSVRGYFII